MNLQHNESAVLQSVYMVGYQSFTLYFGFELNGEEQIGTITNYDSIFVNGLEFGRGKVGNDPESFSKFCEGLDKNLPMKAEIIKKKKKCKAQIIQVRLFGHYRTLTTLFQSFEIIWAHVKRSFLTFYQNHYCYECLKHFSMNELMQIFKNLCLCTKHRKIHHQFGAGALSHRGPWAAAFKVLSLK
jgi:hypothetical protein